MKKDKTINKNKSMTFEEEFLYQQKLFEKRKSLILNYIEGFNDNHPNGIENKGLTNNETIKFKTIFSHLDLMSFMVDYIGIQLKIRCENLIKKNKKDLAEAYENNYKEWAEDFELFKSDVIRKLKQLKLYKGYEK